MRNRPILDALAAVTIIGSGACLWFFLRGVPPRPVRGPHEASGWFMAQEAVRLLKPGGKLAVITRDTEAFSHPESAWQFRRFERELRAARVAPDVIQTLQVDPLKPLEVPPGDFFELMRRFPAGSVIVSFMGPPLLTSDQLARLGRTRPAVIAFCPGALPQRLDLRVLFAAGLLHTAIISRPVSSRAAPPSRSLEAWFERDYQVVKAESVDGLYRPVEDLR